jgi:uncharacterized damage-inducible protein DinB
MFNKLIEYDSWANGFLFGKLLDNDAVPERVNALSSHIIATNELWLARFGDYDLNDFDLWPDYEMLHCVNASPGMAEKWTALLAEMSDEEIENEIEFKTLEGDSGSISLNDALVHLTIHGSHHRGQIITEMRNVDLATPNIDYEVFAGQ